MAAAPWRGNIALSGGQIKKLLIIQFLPLLRMKYISDIMLKGTNGAGQVSAAGSREKGSLQAGRQFLNLRYSGILHSVDC